jgi:hypothetical protein
MMERISRNKWEMAMKVGLRSLVSAAVAAWACSSPEAFATGVATPNNSQTYSAESVALGAGANTVLIQGNNFFYSVLGTTLIPAGSGVSVTFAAPTGNTFSNPGLAARC